MKTVDIIRSGNINAIMGPVGTLKRILIYREYFESRGYQVNVFTFNSIGKGPFTNIANIPKAQMGAPKMTLRIRVASFFRKLAMNNKWLTVLIVKKNKKKTERLIDYYLSLNRNPDIVECHSHYEGYLYLKKRKNTNPRSVVFLHSDGIPLKMEQFNFPQLINTSYFQKLKSCCNWMVSQVDRIAFIANIGQTNFLELYPNRSKTDTVVIRNGIDSLDEQQLASTKEIRERAKNSEFKYRLCSVGTISFRKGHRFIIEALHSLPDKTLKDIHVDFIGEGGERPILEQLVRDYKLEKNVTFCGGIPNKEVFKYLAKNNIFILMSKNEGLPISILEAMRSGLPIIATNVSGIPECIDENYNGLLLEPDSKQLAEILKKLPQYNWEEMGRNSYEKFQREFTFDRMMKDFCDMFDNLIKERKE